jgi:hypothetical protein
MLAAIVAPTDTSTSASQGICPDGFVWDPTNFGTPCVPITTSAPTDITETNPSKLVPLPFVPTWQTYAVVGGAGLVLGIALRILVAGRKR